MKILKFNSGFFVYKLINIIFVSMDNINEEEIIKRVFNNTTAIKALEEVDENLAIETLSDPNLDGEELSEILTTSLMGNIVDKKTKKPLKLSNKVMAAGILNRMEQLKEE